MPTSFGKEAEDYVARHVATLGWKILERNYHSRLGEIDIIAEDHGEIVFVEVKARRGAAFGSALSALTDGKLAKVAATAHAYLEARGWQSRPWRVDAFTIDGEKAVPEHFRNVG